MVNYSPETTWADVYDFVQTHVNQVYPHQSPQLEGPRDLRIFGGVAGETSDHLLVTDVDGKYFVKLNVGTTAGLSPGTTIAIYPPESDLLGSQRQEVLLIMLR